jgi:hypothetical protein
MMQEGKTKVVQVFESTFQDSAYITVLDSRGLMWTTQCKGLPFVWERVNTPPGCVGEVNEGDDPRYQCPMPK